MRNVRVLLQYDGTDFHGWQIQPGRRTVQGILTDVILRLDGRHVTIHGAGRTDAGVHAQGQVANFTFQRDMSESELSRALNGNLPADLRVVDVAWVPPDFHARLNAKSKTYRYRLFTGPVVSPFIHRYVAHCYFSLDVARMDEAARLLIGRHDFSAFSLRTQERSTTIRTVTGLDIVSQEHQVEIVVRAEGFLRGMVRRIAGTLQDVGRGRFRPEQVRPMLEGQPGSEAGPTLPAKGLTLVRVDY